MPIASPHLRKPVATYTFFETGSTGPISGTPSAGIWSWVAQRITGSTPKRSRAQAVSRS